MTARSKHLAVAASYVLAAIVVTFPLICHFTTHIPGRADRDRDAFGFLWNNWWIYHSVTKLHTKPYVTDFIFAPFTVDLRLHTLGLLYGICAIPVMPILGPVGVLNLQILGTSVLNALATFHLTKYVTRSEAGGFVAGLLIASTPAIDFHLTAGPSARL